MNDRNRNRNVASFPVSRNASVALWLSLAALLFSIIGNWVALTIPAIYAALAPAFHPQAVAQDVSNLSVIAPLWLLLVVLALRGSQRAYLLWMGVLAFTVYNYVIYTFSVPFGPLFLLWVIVLGLALWSLLVAVWGTDHQQVRSWFTKSPPVKVTAWTLIVVGFFFAFLWLSEDIPALLAGRTPQSLIDIDLPTNPVHILDLSFFLPAAFVTGIALLRRSASGYTFAPGLLVFLILTGIPIIFTPVLQHARGEPAAWGVVYPIGTLTLLLLALLIWLASTIHPDQPAE
jgi:hypothetical protein